MIHTTIGVYPNGELVVNGVNSANLASHINYNKRMRPGRALIVDGFMIHNGIGVEQYQVTHAISNVEKQLVDTKPYL